ncbi:MAG: hypothetical protein ACM31P_10525 [Actinomycetota bacterium]
MSKPQELEIQTQVVRLKSEKQELQAELKRIRASENSPFIKYNAAGLSPK